MAILIAPCNCSWNKHTQVQVDFFLSYKEELYFFFEGEYFKTLSKKYVTFCGILH